MILELKKVLVVVVVILMLSGCSSAISNSRTGMNNSANSDYVISFKEAKSIAQTVIQEAEIGDDYKLNSAYVYKRLTDEENIAIGFKPGFFNVKNPFVYVVIINKKTGGVVSSGQMK
jgi:hypothetical protein